MSDRNIVAVELMCSEVSDKALVCILVDLDKVVDNNVVIDVGREFLERIGEMATWYRM